MSSPVSQDELVFCVCCYMTCSEFISTFTGSQVMCIHETVSAFLPTFYFYFLAFPAVLFYSFQLHLRPVIIRFQVCRWFSWGVTSLPEGKSRGL